MKLTEAQYESCTCCGHRTRIAEEIYGCDECQKVIDLNTTDYLRVTVHHEHAGADHLELCSWKCVFAALKKVKTTYFVSLPLLQFDQQTPGLRAEDFFAEVRS